MTYKLSGSTGPPPRLTVVGALMVAIFLGLLVAWAFWLNVRESILHPRTPRIAYDVEAP